MNHTSASVTTPNFLQPYLFSALVRGNLFINMSHHRYSYNPPLVSHPQRESPTPFAPAYYIDTYFEDLDVNPSRPNIATPFSLSLNPRQ